MGAVEKWLNVDTARAQYAPDSPQGRRALEYCGKFAVEAVAELVARDPDAFSWREVWRGEIVEVEGDFGEPERVWQQYSTPERGRGLEPPSMPKGRWGALAEDAAWFVKAAEEGKLEHTRGPTPEQARYVKRYVSWTDDPALAYRRAEKLPEPSALRPDRRG